MKTLTMKVFLFIILLSESISVFAQVKIEGDEGYLLFSKKKEQSESYEKLCYMSKKNRNFQIYPSEHYIYYFREGDKNNISIGGSFFFVNRYESGIVEAESGEISKTDNASCMFIEAKSGCITSEASGEMCDGEWSDKSTWATASGGNIVVDSSRPSAEQVMNSYRPIQSKIKLTTYLLSLPIDNVLRCDPVGDVNKKTYMKIAENLPNGSLNKKTLKRLLSELK